VQETVAGVTTSYLVADQNLTGYAQVMDELQGGAVSRTYSYGLGLISESQTLPGSPVTSFYGFDGHGSVRYLTSSTGAVTDTYDYDAFGNLISSTGSTPNSYLFAGEQFDPALGIYYNRARYYDQRVGRFWSMDIDEGDDDAPFSLHKYLYTLADPVYFVDPSGLIGETLDTIYGRQVHEVIGRDFVRATAGLGFSNRTINTILGQRVPLLGRLRPDLANPATAEVYEIKPATALIEGIAQVSAYIAILRVFDSARRQWQFGYSYTPSQNPISLGNGSYAIVFPTINGVIPYKVINFPALIGVAATGVIVSIAEVVQDVALGSLVEAVAF
jgi:RHS repeat-associated protein